VTSANRLRNLAQKANRLIGVGNFSRVNLIETLVNGGAA